MLNKILSGKYKYQPCTMKTSEVPKGSCFWIFTPWYHTVPAVFTSQLVPGLDWFQLKEFGIHRPEWKWYTFLWCEKPQKPTTISGWALPVVNHVDPNLKNSGKMSVSYFVSQKNTMCISFLYLYTQKSIHHPACKHTMSNMERIGSPDPIPPC